MRNHQEDSPSSSINGDEILGMEDDDGMVFLEEVGEIDFNDDYNDDEEPVEEALEMQEDNSIFIFREHNGSVFCCDISPDGKLAVTGGEDDKAYVWRIEDGQLVMQCLGHKDSVIFAGFSFDGAFLATADMAGLIKVWKCEETQQESWPVVFEYEAPDLIWGLWHFGARVLVFGTVPGEIYVFKVPSGETKVLQGENTKAECGLLFHDGVRLAAGYEDGLVKIWDLRKSTVLHQVPASVHQNKVTAIDTPPDDNIMASISHDGKIVLTTPNNGRVVSQMTAEEDLEIVAFSKDLQFPYLATGTLTGAVNIWDVPRRMRRHQCTKAGSSPGITSMMWVNRLLVTGCLDGSVRVYEGRSGEECQKFTGHLSEILDLRYNAKTNLILTASDDGTARLYKLDVNSGND
ncbi:hypothetical protein HW555_006583 [Spodoptera exigua]|uniref:Angio-associated migratory cell protein n=2 Tax=Spodoptera exigua TaxID=7107 RepID=A0A835L9W9_SPOEX|nr:hypothetical protein HW555_006583 [Spodoptera exigua]